MNINIVTYEKIKNAYDRLNYTFYTEEKHINLFGIRDPSNVDIFNDCIGIAYSDSGSFICRTFTATTDPGKYYLLNPMTKKGTAILKEGYHKNAFMFGLHKGQYKALIQASELPVYRDNTKDLVLNMDDKTVEKGWFGINLHRGNLYNIIDTVGKNGAGCQVVKYPNSLQIILDLCRMSGNRYNYTKFNYGLLTLKQFLGE